jgi:hypothetical protein
MRRACALLIALGVVTACTDDDGAVRPFELSPATSLVTVVTTSLPAETTTSAAEPAPTSAPATTTSTTRAAQPREPKTTTTVAAPTSVPPAGGDGSPTNPYDIDEAPACTPETGGSFATGMLDGVLFLFFCESGGWSAVEPFVPETTAADAEQTLRTYFLTAGARDYEAAWAMLTPGYQDDYGSFERFVGFWDRVELVGLDSATLVGATGGTTTIEADVWFTTSDGGRSDELVEVDVTTDASGGFLVAGYRFLSATPS